MIEYAPLKSVCALCAELCSSLWSPKVQNLWCSLTLCIFA